jgi:hypothetical protein
LGGLFIEPHRRRFSDVAIPAGQDRVEIRHVGSRMQTPDATVERSIKMLLPRRVDDQRRDRSHQGCTSGHTMRGAKQMLRLQFEANQIKRLEKGYLGRQRVKYTRDAKQADKMAKDAGTKHEMAIRQKKLSRKSSAGRMQVVAFMRGWKACLIRILPNSSRRF